jgi:hypothetical protein
MVARHTPLPLLEALLHWRERYFFVMLIISIQQTCRANSMSMHSFILLCFILFHSESPKGAHDASTYQKKVRYNWPSAFLFEGHFVPDCCFCLNRQHQTYILLNHIIVANSNLELEVPFLIQTSSKLLELLIFVTLLLPQLAVECIFCSACIRFAEYCPQEGITGCLVFLFLQLLSTHYFLISFLTSRVISLEKLWIGLESFIFDWLINADR